MDIGRRDPEAPGYAEASRQARDHCWQLISAYREPASLRRFFIKAKLPGPQVTAWLHLRDIVPHSYVGELVGPPVDARRDPLGTLIHVPAEDLVDWAIIDSGVLLGGFTVRVQSEHGAESRQQILQDFGATEFADLASPDRSVVDARLRRLLAKQVPLVELEGRLRAATAADAACRAAHRLSEGLVARAYYPPNGRTAGSILIQVDPDAAIELGVELRRVPLHPDDPEAGYWWHSDGLGRLDDLVGDVLDALVLSQPGGYDEGQPWGPDAPQDTCPLTLIALLSEAERDAMLATMAANLARRPGLVDRSGWDTFPREQPMYLTSYPPGPLHVGMTFTQARLDGISTPLPRALTITHLVFGAYPIPVPHLEAGHKGLVLFEPGDPPSLLDLLPSLAKLDPKQPRIGLHLVTD